ncbi:hypothetical protein PFISCL1PPCAC_23721 [Pristionchus fissidentatus]|uniref:Schwannomin interacting protein 1 C-terminal domain-containing protein n=1 Tax=Pristionchus fissidentatus TaxID=1538716 RepID=A0AAV5WRT0_9BILA|nr:hypothetical protein PFISCL1PPCAC_23721 [Pristionchus fissidentatus]
MVSPPSSSVVLPPSSPPLPLPPSSSSSTHSPPLSLPPSSELNNNDSFVVPSSSQMVDLVSLLHLSDPSTLSEGEDQVSHASSLESLIPRMGSHSPVPSHDSSHSISASTSCSSSSFEMASTSSFSEEDARPSIPTSLSLHTLPSRHLSNPIRDSIDREISQLDTSLSSFDFSSLEHKLVQSKATEKEQARKRLGEEVRRRLAMEVDSQPCSSFSSSSSSFFPSIRPLKSALGKRLQVASSQLQVCYMNDLSESPSSSDGEEEEGGRIPSFPSSKSVPDFKEAAARARFLRRSAIHGKRLTPEEREDLLRAETIAVRSVASNEGRRTVDELREQRRMREGERRRHSRHLLSKMPIDTLREIHEGFEDRIEATNAQLVSLLMARDSLHMERDSILVDIGDVVEGHRSKQIDIPTLLRLQDTNPHVPHDLSTPT